jgi:hypothetical protein
MDPAKERAKAMRRYTQRYEEIIGCSIDSDEFKRRVEQTVAALQQPQ